MTRFRWQQVRQETAGFTLVELLGVSIIVIILSLMALQVYASATDRSRLAKSQEELRRIEVALERHKADYGYYPSRLQDLVRQGYLKPTTFESPWSGNRKIYYFYAVDDINAPLAFALGDPGPRGDCGTSVPKFLSEDRSKPLPCRRPDWKALHFTGPDPTLIIEANNVAASQNGTIRSLRNVRRCTATNQQDVFDWVGCIARTES